MTSPRTSGSAARIAAAGLLALALMLPLGACAATDEFIADAQSQTETIDEDLGRVGTQLVNLPWHLRAEVEDAVGSAQAATDEARAALVAAADPQDDGRAAIALADAQVALDAASAQLRYVTDMVLADGDDTGLSLRALQGHIDELRGETVSASV